MATTNRRPSFFDTGAIGTSYHSWTNFTKAPIAPLSKNAGLRFVVAMVLLYYLSSSTMNNLLLSPQAGAGANDQLNVVSCGYGVMV